jgi:hypothetical protein
MALSKNKYAFGEKVMRVVTRKDVGSKGRVPVLFSVDRRQLPVYHLSTHHLGPLGPPPWAVFWGWPQLCCLLLFSLGT